MKDDQDLAFNVKFVKTVAQWSILYDYTDPNYTNRHIQDKAWKEIGIEMNESGLACKEKWKNIRSAYTRYLRQKLPISCSSGSTKKQYYLAKYLDFLYPFTKTRKRRSNILPPETITVDSIDNETDEEINLTEQSDILTSKTITVNSNNEVISEDSDTRNSYLEVKDEIIIIEENMEAEEEDTEQALSSTVTTETTNNKQKLSDPVEFIISNSKDNGINPTILTEIPNKKQKMSDPLSNVIVEYVTSNSKDNEEIPENADLQFLKSLLPDLQKMNSYQKYQFKLRTMQTIGDLLYKQ